jgi:hypothetical protein
MRYPAGFISAFYNPLKNPDAPTIGTATGGNASASVTFTAPANVGGGAITGFTVVSSPTGITGTGASSPVTVSGLSNGTAYTFKVFATNSYGPGPLSAASNSVTPVAPPSVIGEAYGGGYYAGQIGVSSVATHYIIVGPLASAQTAPIRWKNARTATAGADSVIDGPQNTADMVADGNSTVYPAAHFCNDLSTGGQTDWYMPAQNELEICYYNLKPSSLENDTASGINPNAVPARASVYANSGGIGSNPAQTSVAIFQTGGAEAFGNTLQYYWTSTEVGTQRGGFQAFGYGLQSASYKDTNLSNSPVRAIRRIPV